MRQKYALRLKPGTYPPPLAAGMYLARSARRKSSKTSFTSKLRAAQTWGSYQQAYDYMDENFFGMVDVVKVDSTPSRVKVPLWSLISLAIAAVVGTATLAAWQLTNPCSVRSQDRGSSSCYQEPLARPLIIGIVSASPNEDYNALAAYLQARLGRLVNIDSNTSFEKSPERIAHKDWDIAFTRSPIFSIEAESNHYTGVAVMFPEEPPYYRAALYVRSDSPIQSIADINSKTTIALGSPESAPTFYLPIYALYGKSLRVGTGYRPIDVVKMVKAGKVDIGAGRYTAIKGDPALRMIYVSRDIPGAGVYLSPLLPIPDQMRLKEALQNAPPDIKAKADYGNGPIPKYNQLRQIILKTEKIFNCPRFNLQSFELNRTVNLFCKNQHQHPNLIEGKVRKYKVLNQGNIQFKVVTPKNQVYLVLVSKRILKSSRIDPMNALDQSVQVQDVKPLLLADGTWSVKITQLNQLALLNK